MTFTCCRGWSHRGEAEACYLSVTWWLLATLSWSPFTYYSIRHWFIVAKQIIICVLGFLSCRQQLTLHIAFSATLSLIVSKRHLIGSENDIIVKVLIIPSHRKIHTAHILEQEPIRESIRNARGKFRAGAKHVPLLFRLIIKRSLSNAQGFQNNKEVKY